MKQKHNKSVFFALLFGVLLFSWGMRSQNAGIGISWDKEVGCQHYSSDDHDIKDPIFLEDIVDGVCIKVCEKSIVTYTLSGNMGTTPNTQWIITGGTVLSSTDTTCMVQWGTVGNGGITFVVNSPNGVVNRYACIEKIVIPNANFTVNTVTGAVITSEEIEVPPTKPKPIYACVGQSIQFENLSTVSTDIVSYFWDFGDEIGTSTEFEPSYTFTHEQDYTVILTVYNSCNCSSSIKKTVHVKGDGGFEILCPGVVCEGETVTYSLPFEGQAICHDSYVWHSAGSSHQPEVNQQNGNATVTWDAPGNDGFGYLTFVPTDCDLACLLPTTIKVPVIKTHGTIYGDAAICAKTQSIYSLPQWPTTDFHWTILEDPTETAVDIILSDQRNQVILYPHQPGVYTLMATYENTLLHCGGTATFVITVSATTDFLGPNKVCQNSTATYYTASGLPTTWVLRNSAGAVVATTNPNPGVNFTYTFTSPGNYSLSVGTSGTCAGQQKNISVLALPTAPSASSVLVLNPDDTLNPGSFVQAASLAVCPNAPYTYKVPNNPTAQYQWSVTHGTIEGAVSGVAIGNEVVITFDGTAAPTISVSAQNLTPIPCSSAPLPIPINLKTIIAQINGNAQETVCANTEHNVYTAKTTIPTLADYTDGDTYTWSITPNTLGSITSGQSTFNIEVTWNNVTVQTVAYVNLVIIKCTLSKTVTIPVLINPVPVISLVASPPSACSGDQISFSIVDTNGVALTSATGATWNFGYGEQAGAVGENYTFTNITSSGPNAGHDVTVYVTNPNGCLGLTNTASVHVTVFPGPPATASLSSQYNAFCDPSTIDATLTMASTFESTNSYQWYNGNTLLVGETGPTLQVTPDTGFGNYYFIATNSAGCHTKSNIVAIIEFCGNGSCTFLASHPL